MTNPARSTEGRLRFENVQRAVRLSARLSDIGFDDLPGLRAAFAELIGKPVDDRFMVIPPFSTDCGFNIAIGSNLFINQGCHFMDMGGITIGDDVMIGPKVNLVSAGHPVSPSERRNGIVAKPIVIGNNVWIGAAATILWRQRRHRRWCRCQPQYPCQHSGRRCSRPCAEEPLGRAQALKSGCNGL
jgi:acetyltransferase-like isoleucine patch superfamily enzyme